MVVPPLPAGEYDLTVVNITPDGVPTVGFQAAAYRATVVSPPVIDDVSPTLIETDTGQPVTVTGQIFNNLDGLITGDTSSSALDTFLGYRFMF